MSSVLTPDRRFSLRKTLEGHLGWIAGLAFVGGILIRVFFDKKEVLRDTGGAFCDAIFIAAFLAAVVDPRLKLDLLREALKDIFPFIYGYGLPQELKDFFQDTVVGTKLMRKDCKLHWIIKLHPSIADRVILVLRASFVVINFDEARNYTHDVFAISDTPGDNAYVAQLSCMDLNTGEYMYQLERNELRETRKGYKSGDPIQLEANDRKGRYRMGVTYYSEASLMNGVDQFSFTEVTAQADVVITVDERLKNHMFSIVPAPPSDQTAKPPKYSSLDGDHRCHWEYPRLFVPHETLILRWERQPAASSAALQHHAGSSALHANGH